MPFEPYLRHYLTESLFVIINYDVWGKIMKIFGKKRSIKPWTDDNAVFDVQDLIFKAYGAPEFRDMSFHCYRDLPLEWRMPVMTNTFEGEIINGGLAQFLWNTFYHYRAILQDAKAGYDLVGSAAHANAIANCMEICARYEDECGICIRKCIRNDNSSLFDDWYEMAETEMSFPEEGLFESDSDISRIKGKWIIQHVDLYRELMK